MEPSGGLESFDRSGLVGLGTLTADPCTADECECFQPPVTGLPSQPQPVRGQVSASASRPAFISPKPTRHAVSQATVSN
jgi:hypothetical protein